MEINTNSEKIKELLSRRVETIMEADSLEKKLLSGKKLRIKHGIDPTGPKIHLGRAVQFWKLREFQEMGHQIILIIGDFTAQIGDASDKTSMRKPLTEREIKENMKGYKAQIGKILDLKKTEIRYNSEWLGKLSIKDLMRLSGIFTAQQLIQRRNFKERWEQGNSIGLIELNYPLFQGYDSVVVEADVEVGGTDQTFNLLAGRKIQEYFKTNPLFCSGSKAKFYVKDAQDAMTLKMLDGLDGRKMSTSWGNIIAIIDEPDDMFGKAMSMRDEAIPMYFELCVNVPLKEIEKINNDLTTGTVNPRDVKAKLAKEIVSLYYGKDEAEKAEKEFEKVFQKKEAPSEIREIEIIETEVPIQDLLVKTGLVESRSEAKRLILQKGVKINGDTQSDWQAIIAIKSGLVVQSGKRNFVKIK
jgi:tyrosyl-tRNA synthetase